MKNRGKKIGQILIEAGLVSDKQLSKALEKQKRDGGRICSHLIKLGYLNADALLEFLRLQFGVAAVNISNYRIKDDILSLVPVDIARKFHVVPVNVLDDNLILAMEDPRDEKAIKKVEEHTSLKVEPLICPQSVVKEALHIYYPTKDETQPKFAARKVFSLEEKIDHPAVYNQEKAPRDLSPADWLKRVIVFAIKKRSREIHLEPREEQMIVRYRAASKLINVEAMPLESGRSIVGLLLNYNGRSPSNSREKPAEGYVKVKVRNRELKLVFSTFPVIYGDRVVMKLVDESFLRMPFTERGLDKAEEEKIMAVLDRRAGLYLISSPLSRQRDSTMYHLIDTMKNDNINIITIEPSVLFPIPGVNQNILSSKGEYEQKEMLLAALRQEPDILGLADLNGYDVLQNALNAASQCLVLGTAPMGSTYEVISWLQGCSYNSASLAQLLLGVLALRVIPRLCPECRKPFEGRIELLEGTRDKKPEEMTFYESSGCERCEGTGKDGNLGLFESFVMDDELSELLTAAAPARVIYEEAQRRGMRTILEDGLIKASEGEVDVRDVLRVIPGWTEK